MTFTGAEWRLVQQESASRVMQLWHYDWMAQVPKGSSRGHQATLAIPREPNPYIAPRTVLRDVRDQADSTRHPGRVRGDR